MSADDPGRRDPVTDSTHASTPPPDGHTVPEAGAVAAKALAVAALLLARRFSAGATLWSVAPDRDDHARHVAVEFVHPVVVGSPSLPALAIAGADLVGQARTSIHSGDILLLIGEADRLPLAELAARAVAWGATTVWLALDALPTVGDADVVVTCAHESDIVRAYHLLWELCHVCLQHPGVLAPATVLGSRGCAVCVDDAVTAEVTGLGEHSRVWLRTASGPLDAIDLVGGLQAGDLVLAHAGTVIGRRS